VQQQGSPFSACPFHAYRGEQQITLDIRHPIDQASGAVTLQ